ncbi:MAG: hypothetical protein LBK42_11110 [Propionibacteriaceae bacterium]|nr:hypothetical protein [Propionibacteriaceae bacterium]
MGRLLSGRRRRVASVAPVVALAVALAGLAVAQDGFAITELELDDSGVWVTSQARLSLGRFNYNAGRLDGALVASTDDFEVLQDGAQVFLHDPVAGQLAQVSPARMELGGPVELPAGAQVALGGGRAAVWAPSLGSLWVMAETAVASFQVDSEAFPPVLTDLPANAAMTVGTDGETHLFDPAAGRLISLGGG